MLTTGHVLSEQVSFVPDKLVSPYKKKKSSVSKSINMSYIMGIKVPSKYGDFAISLKTV
jgi:hypothetical protein